MQTLYKRDSKGAIRTWACQLDGTRYRYITGLLGGQLVESTWTEATPKSRPTAEEQAAFEVQSAYEYQLKREYFESIDQVDTPRFFKPMLAHKYEGWKDTCYSQPKLDGIRCIAKVDGLFSREGQPITAIPHIQAALAPLFEQDPDLILDGELYSHALKDDFNQISSIVRKKKPTEADLKKAEEVMQYHVYDMPSHPGSFADRLNALLDIWDVSFFELVLTHKASSLDLLDRMYGQYLAQGYEGQMVRFDVPYEQKRSKSLLKRKEFQDQEYEIVRFEEGVGNWSGCAKAVICRLPDGREFGSGIKGTQEAGKALLAEGGKYKRATIKFFQLTPDGVPRFGVATQFHEEGDRL